MSESRILTSLCGNCGRKLQVKTRSAEKVVACPECNTPVTVSASAAMPEEAPRSAAPSSVKLYSFACPNCGSEMEVSRKSIGKATTCRECQQKIRVPDPTVKDAKEKPPTGDALFGAAGLVCEIIFFTGIAIKPGSFEAVMLGGMLGLAGLVLAIIGIATGRGRGSGTIAVVLFFLAWVVNTWIIGRL